jgi:hypothetical protein
MYTRVNIICQEGKMESYKLASLLLNIRGISITSAAKSCGLNASAVAGWLKGVPGRLSQEKQNIFLGYLGISGGTLASDRVHLWTIDHNLEPLREILAWVGEEFENIVLIPQNIRVKDWLPTSNLFLLYSSPKSIRILLRQKISPLVLPGPKSWVNPTNLPHVKWFEYKKGSGIIDKLTTNPLLLIPRNRFDKFMSDSSVSLEEYDQTLELMKKTPPQEKIPTKQRKSLTSKELREIRERAEDVSVGSGVLREDIWTLLDHIESNEGK